MFGYTQMRAHKDNVETLRYVLAELLVKQSSPALTSKERTTCKKLIDAMQAAVEALDTQIHA